MSSSVESVIWCVWWGLGAGAGESPGPVSGTGSEQALVQPRPLSPLLQSLPFTPCVSVWTSSDLLTVFCLALFFFFVCLSLQSLVQVSSGTWSFGVFACQLLHCCF